MPQSKQQRVILGEYRVSDPMRLDVFLAQQKEIKSRSSAKHMAEDGLVQVDGKTCKKVSLQLSAGETVTVFGNPKKLAAKQKASVSDIVLPVLYEDDACFVINKPAGIAVHPGNAMQDDELTILALLETLFAQRSLPFSEGEALVHRLDKETTGCLLIAKTPKAHLLLQNQFRDRSIEKTYLALVDGVPKHARAIIDSPIGRNVSQRTKMSVMQSMRSREAQTEYRILDASHEVALLECDLFTGRTHQIRVHLSSIGHSILGDKKYPSEGSKNLEKKFGIDFLCLHAWKLAFQSPETGKRIDVQAPMPKTMKILFEKLEVRVHTNVLN